MIKKLSLFRFKRFHSATMELTPFSVLMGENSSGKTSILQAINLALNSLYRHELVTIKHDDTVRIRDRGVGLSSLPGIGLSDFREIYFAKVSRGGRTRQSGDDSIGATIELTDELNCLFRLQISSLFGGFNIKCTSTISDFPSIPDLQQSRPLFISGFVGLLAAEERSFPVAIADRLDSGRISAIIRNLLLDTKQESPEKYQQLKNRLSDDFGFELDTIDFNERQDLYVTAHYGERVQDQHLDFDFNASGSGFMQVLQILTPIYRYCPEQSKIVLLDEPDAHLHPNLQRTLSSSLRQIQKELNIQIVISTHSTAIIRSALPSEVIPVSSREPTMKPLVSRDEVEENISSHLDSYDLGKSVISGKILFIEDKNLDIYHRIDESLKTQCFSGPNTMPIMPGRSKDDKLPFNVQELLQNYLDRHIDVHYIRDSDGLPEEFRNHLLEYSNSHGVNLHILERYEIENYILIPKSIRQAILNITDELLTPSEEEIESNLCNFLKDTISLSRFNYDFTLEDSIYKTALLLGIDEYRNLNRCKSLAISTREEYENFDSFFDLVKVGMGKEALKLFLCWVNEELHIQLSRRAIIDEIIPDHISNDIKTILNNLSSSPS